MSENENPDEIVSRSILGRKTLQFWDKFLAWLFSNKARSYLKGKRLLHIEDPFPEYESFFTKYSRFGTERGIVCTVSGFQEDIDLLNEVIEKIHAHYELDAIRELICADLWGKAVSYRMLVTGANCMFSSRFHPSPILYSLDTIFELWSDIKAFGFVSNKDEAILLFRGTDISFLSHSGRASMLSDMDPEGPGLALFEAAKESIREWLEAQKNAGKECRVIGHSLGGALACYSLIEFPELFSKTHSSYATNYPGVNERFFKKWNSLKERPKFYGIVTEGDLVSKCGFLLNNTELFVAEKDLPPMMSHELLFGAEAPFSLYEINIQDENKTKSRRLISKFHRGTSSILYQMGLKHILPSKKERE